MWIDCLSFLSKEAKSSSWMRVLVYGKVTESPSQRKFNFEFVLQRDGEGINQGWKQGLGTVGILKEQGKRELLI